jgi:hypothetical protein
MPMKTSSAAPPVLLDRSRAKACIAANTFVLPGLGSILAGRKVGYVQAVLAVIGFSLSSLWFIGFVLNFIRTGDPLDGFLDQLPLAVGSVALFAIAWIWAQFTNRRIWLAVKDLPENPRPGS